MFVDTHCHLYLNPLEQDLESVLARARELGVGRILVPGIDLETSRAAVRMSEQYAEIYAAVGVHPNDSTSWKADTAACLRELSRHPKVVAIGEIGLDHYREHAPHDLQLAVLRAQLDLAGELDLPVVIHNRAAGEALWPELLRWRAARGSGSKLASRPGVLHSFDGTMEAAQEMTANDFLLGISGPVTFKNASEKQQIVQAIRLDALLIETDAPYLTPHPHRGKINEPAFVIHVAEKIAALHQVSLLTVANQTTQNAARLFRWDLID